MAFYEVLMNHLTSFFDEAIPFDNTTSGREFQTNGDCLMSGSWDVAFYLGTFRDPSTLFIFGVSGII